jgi:hypothetical protein
MPIDIHKVHAFEKQIEAIELIYNLTRVQVDYFMTSIQRYEEKERKCQESIFYRNFYKRVKEAQIKPLYSVVNTYGGFNEIAKPVNNGNLTQYAEALASYALTLQCVITNIKAYENELKSIHTQYKEIYHQRIKSWFYCVVYDS